MSHHCDDDETTFRIVTAEQAARRCEHGSVSAHGEVGKDWCPGALPPLTEAWRQQLVDQMNTNPVMFTKFAGTGRFSVEHPPPTQTLRERFTPPADTVVTVTSDPLGVLQHASVALQHYAKCPMVVGVSHESTPIYDALVAEWGRAMVHESDGKVCTHPRVSLWCAWTMSMVVPS